MSPFTLAISTLACIAVLVLIFGDDIDQAVICIGLAFAYFMSGQEGVET